jgi:hypothetical protein
LQAAGDLSKGFLTAGAINYFVCRSPLGAKALSAVPKAMSQTKSGDPAGTKTLAKAKKR